MYAGNDIVAYTHPRCVNKWKNTPFVHKILVQDEVLALQQTANNAKDAHLWSLWTLKEAGYKLSCFLGNRNKFHAKQFAVQFLPSVNCIPTSIIDLPFNQKNGALVQMQKSIVIFDKQTYYGETLITEHFVHSIVKNALVHNEVIWAIDQHNHTDKNDFSAAVRAFAKHSLLQQHLPLQQIEKDKDGIPYVIYNNQAMYISLSHDQQFVSFAFCMQQ